MFRVSSAVTAPTSLLFSFSFSSLQKYSQWKWFTRIMITFILPRTTLNTFMKFPQSPHCTLHFIRVGTDMDVNCNLTDCWRRATVSLLLSIVQSVPSLNLWLFACAWLCVSRWWKSSQPAVSPSFWGRFEGKGMEKERKSVRLTQLILKR